MDVNMATSLYLKESGNATQVYQDTFNLSCGHSYCINCVQTKTNQSDLCFLCNKSEQLYSVWGMQNQHDDFVHSIVDGDENLTLKINESLKHMQESVEKREENIKTLQLHAQTFEEDRQKVAENINSLMSKVKRNIKEEFDRIMKTLDECHKNTLQLLINKANEEKTKLEQIIADAKMQLQHLREAMTALQKYLFSLASATENFSPLSSTAELLKFLKETYYDAHRRQDNLKQLIVDYPMKKLSVASKWKTNINNWLQLRTKIMSNINEIPPLDDSDITVLAENRFVF